MKTMGKRKIREAIIAALAVLSIALIVFGYEQDRRVRALTLQVNAAHQKAFYETIELMSGVQLNLEKLLVTNSGPQEQSLLVTIARQAEGAQDNLAAMPVSHETVAGALKFVNQISDFTTVLAEKLVGDVRLTREDLEQIAVLHQTCVQVNGRLYEILGQFERGELVFSAEEVTQAVELQDSSQPAVDYPVLLYDGPFSDATNTNVFKALGSSFLTEQQAQEKLIDYIGRDRVTLVTFLGETEIDVPSYDFTIETESGTLDASMTQQGGDVLYILPERGEDSAVLSVAECLDLAARFLQRNGYGPMEVNYWRQLGGILTANFAAVQNDIPLYSDLVKVQISMRTGLVVGIEAGNYLRNHTRREFPEVTITIEDALRRVNDSLTIERTRLCVIPLGTGETLCWEASGFIPGGDRYLVYIDAQTGNEATILRVTQDSEGFVTQ